MRWAVIILTLGLASCQSTQQVIIKEKLKVITPDEVMYYCPVLTKKDFPNSVTLTDTQVARLLTKAAQNNWTCASSMKALKKFIKESKVIAEK